MPRGRKPEGEQALSNAERQARYRARHMASPSLVAARPRHHADRRSRPQRWRDAVSELLSLQAAYADWLAVLPDSLQASATAEALEAILELDLADLAGVELPRGYGRD
jgi:rhamnogalacturonyl hydrolase YesR